MEEREKDLQQMTTGRILTRVTAIRTEPTWYVLYTVSHRGASNMAVFSVTYTQIEVPHLIG